MYGKYVLVMHAIDIVNLYNTLLATVTQNRVPGGRGTIGIFSSIILVFREIFHGCRPESLTQCYLCLSLHIPKAIQSVELKAIGRVPSEN